MTSAPTSPQRGVTPRGATAHSSASTAKPFLNSASIHVLSSKQKSPSWSLGGRSELKAQDIGPGPGAYTPDILASKPKPPAYSMLARKNDMASATVPGPGAYSPDGKLRTKIPISLQSRHFPKDGAANQPGPGAYTPVNPNFVQTKWTMVGRSKGDKTPATPGPLDYRPEKPQSARASTIHSKIKYKDSMAIHNPGPGAYDETPTSKIRRKAPSYTLLGRTSYEPMSCNTPGPGAYQAPGVRTPIAYSLTPRREIKMSASTPGPGAYSPSGKQGRAAGVGIGDRWNQKESLANPGPGAYTPSVDFYSKKETSPKYSMTARRDSIPSAANPGPGAYTPAIDTIKVRSPRYSLQGKTESLKSPITPGPAHYNPQRPVTSPGISIKSRIDVKPAFVTPSPAHYELTPVDRTIKPMAPQYSLGGRDSYKANGHPTPGPGQYETAFTF